MSDARRTPAGGSRFLYEPFDYGPAQVREVHEKLLDLKFSGIDGRLIRMESMIERLEKRLWLTVYGVVGTILAQAIRSLLTLTPTGGM